MKINKTLVDVKIDELLSTRNNLKENIKRINRLLNQAYELKKDFPYRWYVTCNDIEGFKRVYEFLKSKNAINKESSYKNAYIGCGYGLIDNEFLFIPEDCNYNDGRELSIDEFDFIKQTKEQTKKENNEDG